MTTPALEAVTLYRFFHAGHDEVLALRGVSLEAAPGEVVAVVGPSGSGKSTLLACLSGVDEPDGGQVRVAGHVLTRRGEARRAQLRARYIGVLFQSDNLVGHLGVTENVRLAQRLAGRDDEARRVALLESVGLAGRAAALPSQLSGGEAVRAALAVALANDPAVVVADEPTGELDSSTEQTVLELLLAQAGSGTAVVIATHSDAVASIADRTVRLEDGKVRA
ncbi:MAG: putative transport system ATP-binding protein [Acidimicrobiaceae bacterium]|nr:putative transport system ATP-binding protein [Acidimicrobiaceae bacterium]